MTQEALKLALEALQFAYNHCDSDWVQDEKINPAITAIKEALAKEQEPVAWMDADGKTFPFVWNVSSLGVQQGSKYLDETLTPLYTTPPQRTWVGLAAEDRLTAKYMQDAPDGIEAVIDYIESKLKELNG